MQKRNSQDQYYLELMLVNKL